ncbi:DNA primase [soil metagenome]
MISQETIQQIVNRIDIIEILSSFLKLKKRGQNYIGLCPFHNEKTPSFIVSPAKEIYKCFGCGRSGNAIGFLMEHEKYSYVESLKWLAAKYNIEIEDTDLSPELKARQLVSDSLYIINNFAQQYFTDQLSHSAEGEDIALAYLKERGYREEVIKKFSLGYNPESGHSFSKAALNAKYQEDLLEKSGLVVRRGADLHDNYRGRIIFPVHNHTGKISGFGARIIRSNDRAPKYINTPENDIYIKSKILYGSWFARQAIDKADECLLVEGYTDVISLHQEGIENVVASGGTSLTPDQLRLIKKYTKNLTIIYDGDKAGINAALRGLNLALEEGLNVYLLLLPDNEDPDSLIKKIGGSKFEVYLRENKKDSVIFQIENAALEAGDDTRKKSVLVNAIAESISKINKAEDFVKQQEYIRKTAQLLKIDEAGMNNLVNTFIRENLSKADKRRGSTIQQQVPSQDDQQMEKEIAEATDLTTQDYLQEKALVRCLLEFGINEWDTGKNVADFLLYEVIDEEMISDPLLLKIISFYKEWYEDKLEPTVKNFTYSDDLEMSNMVISLIEFPYEISRGWNKHYEKPIPTREDNYKKDIRSTLNYLELKKIRTLIMQNEIELADTTSIERQLLLVQTQNHLKNMEMRITSEMGMVILK